MNWAFDTVRWITYTYVTISVILTSIKKFRFDPPISILKQILGFNISKKNDLIGGT